MRLGGVSEQRLEDTALLVLIGPGEWLVLACVLRLRRDQRLDRCLAGLAIVQLIHRVEVLHPLGDGVLDLADADAERPVAIVAALVALVVPHPANDLAILRPVALL